MWPEPDWLSLKQSGIDQRALVEMFRIYSNIRPNPREQHWSTPPTKWRFAYIQSVEILKNLFLKVRTVEDSEMLFKSYLVELRERVSDFTEASNHIKDVYAKFSTGKENNKKSIGSAFSKNHHDILLTKWLLHNGWPENLNAQHYLHFPVEMEDGTWRIAELTKTSYQWTHDIYDLPSALKICRERNEELFKKEVKSSEKELPIFTPKRNLSQGGERIGPDNRTGDKTGDDLIATFKFRGIQYGNSLSDIERQYWINNAYDALLDLSEMLNLKPGWLSLPSKNNDSPPLGLAFGARGVGGSGASAHFEPSLNVINLTRKNGFGSAAHEWGHALDLRLGLSSGIDSHLSENLLENRFLYYGMDHNPAFSEGWKKKIAAFVQIVKAINSLENSNYYARSCALAEQKRGKKYWRRTTELFARAFESYIQDKLAANRRYSPWLVHGTLQADCPAGRESMWPYPIRDEREQLNELFDIFFKVLNG